jgi:hypothetical protein
VDVEPDFTFSSVWDTVAYVRLAGYGTPARRRQPSRLWKGSVIALMVLGALAMWIANPILWLWIIAPLQPSPPSMGIYVLLLAGFILTCVAIGKGLSMLNRYYARITGATPTIRRIAPWRRGWSEKRERATDRRQPASVLDVIMVSTAALAVASFAVWFFTTHTAPVSPQSWAP